MYVNRDKLESPLEEIFIQQFEKWIAEDSEIIPQYEVETINGNFRIDFVITLGATKIGIELDGKEFHDEWKDEWRDSLILGNQKLTTIYRFRGKDITTHINECIFIIFLNDNEIFNERYGQVSKTLVEFKNFDDLDMIFKPKQDLNTYHIETTNEFGEKTGRYLELRIIRRTSLDKKQYWFKLYEFAIAYPNKNIEQLIELRKVEIKNRQKGN